MLRKVNEIKHKKILRFSMNWRAFYRNVSFSKPSLKNNMHSPQGITKNQAVFGRLIEIMIFFLLKFGANFGMNCYHQLACCVEEYC